MILSAASVLMRSIGVSFGVFISNRIGADGVGLYTLIMSIYLFAVTLATSGVNTASTRLVAEELAKGGRGNARKAMRACLLYALGFGLFTCLLLIFGAGFIGPTLLGDERTVRSLRALALSMPAIALSSAMNGYFLAVRRVVKSASAQLLEQLCKIGFCVALLAVFAGKGIEYACFAIVLGGAAAEIAELIYFYILYRADLRKTPAAPVPFKVGRLTAISLPVAFAAYARSALYSIQQILIPAGLVTFGLTRTQALAQYGIVSGMVLPIVLFPSAFILAFSGLLIPEMTEFQTQGDDAHIQRTIGRVLAPVYAFCAATGAVLFCFGDELGMLLYRNEQAGLFIKILAPLVLAMYSDSVVDGMLKGLNQQAASMRYNLIDSAISLFLVWLLVPKLGIWGYVIVIFAGEILNALLSLQRLLSVSRFRMPWIETVVKPALCGGMAAAVTMLARGLLPRAEVSWPALLPWGAFCVLTFLLCKALCSVRTEQGVREDRRVK